MPEKQSKAPARWKALEDLSRETRKLLLSSTTRAGPHPRGDGLDELNEEPYKAFADSAAALQVFLVAAQIKRKRELRIRESLASVGVKAGINNRIIADQVIGIILRRFLYGRIVNISAAGLPCRRSISVLHY